MIKNLKFALILAGLGIAQITYWGRVQAQEIPHNDVNTPLHLLQPDYKVPYGIPDQAAVKSVLNRVFQFVNTSTPAELMDSSSREIINSWSNFDKNAIFRSGNFRLISYEWGVLYAALTYAGKNLSDSAYEGYVNKRLNFLLRAVPYYQDFQNANPDKKTPVYSILNPHALDDAGAMAAAFIKAEISGIIKKGEVLDQIEKNYLDYILKKQFRLADGTLARNRPQERTLWLDDLFMSIPAMAQMGKLTGEDQYFKEAVRQYRLFSKRMFDSSKGLFMHGWVEGMKVHPEYFWGRANGWALLTNVELLDVLPEGYEGRDFLLDILKKQLWSLRALQSSEGLWHQLLDRPDSYLETSATAIFVYCMAHAINKGWIDKRAYAPSVLLGWNGVSTKINREGQIEGVCVGTGMGFDPAFYYYRPTSVYAAHGYGPVFLAGTEIIKLLHNFEFEINDSSVQLKE